MIVKIAVFYIDFVVIPKWPCTQWYADAPTKQRYYLDIIIIYFRFAFKR